MYAYLAPLLLVKIFKRSKKLVDCSAQAKSQWPRPLHNSFPVGAKLVSITSTQGTLFVCLFVFFFMSGKEDTPCLLQDERHSTCNPPLDSALILSPRLR